MPGLRITSCWTHCHKVEETGKRAKVKAGQVFRFAILEGINEMGGKPDAIECQLAHAESNKVREAYPHAAQYLVEERTRMLQAWADYLDSLRAGADVMAFKRWRWSRRLPSAMLVNPSLAMPAVCREISTADRISAGQGPVHR